MQTPVESKSPDSGCGGLLLRLFWMFFGNMALLALAILIGQKRTLPNHLTDVLFGITVIMLVIVRYVDISYFEGTTSHSEPATMKHWRQYSIGLVLIALVVWAIANGFAFLS